MNQPGAEDVALPVRGMRGEQEPSPPPAPVPSEPSESSESTSVSSPITPRPTVFNRIRCKLDEKDVGDRPLWQRIVYPFLGVAAIIGGLFAAVMPVIPGGLLIPIGFVFLMCFHPRCERWMKRLLCRVLTWIERIWLRMFPARPGDR